MAALPRAFYPVDTTNGRKIMDERRVRLAPYLGGILWRLNAENADSRKVRVQYCGNLGVVVNIQKEH
jgi:hypothetical protein